MKYLKKTFIILVAVMTVLFSIKFSYADGGVNTISKISPLSQSHGEIVLVEDLEIEGETISTDLRIYQDVVVKSAEKDSEDQTKVLLTLDTKLQEGYSYSMLSISGVEGSMEFDILGDLDGMKIKNDMVESGAQGIEKITIIDESLIEVYFVEPIIEDLQMDELEFKFYKNIVIEKFSKTSDLDTIVFSLSDEFENNSDYVATITVIEGEGADKVDIESGIYDFSTKILEREITVKEEKLVETDEKNVATSSTSSKDDDEKSLEERLMESMGEVGLFTEEVKNEDEDKEMTLEEELLDSMKNSDILNNLVEGAGNLLDEEEELKRELLAASEDVNNIVETQLENLALSTEETPDTGAETWVLFFLTFIINTFYFLSRRKKAQMA